LVRAEGPTGHGSRFIQNTAVAKLMGVVQKALAFRKGQEEALGWGTPLNHEGCKHATARKLGK
jgi:aminoacylase